MRTLTEEFKDAIEVGPVIPAYLVFLDFDPDPVYAWDGVGTLSHDDQTWQGLGQIAQIEPLAESADIRTTELGMTLFQIPNDVLSDLSTLSWKGRAVEVTVVLFAADRQTVIGSELFFKGTIDTLTVEVGPELSAINIVAVNELVKLRHSYGYIYTNEDHKILHPTDTALRFSAVIQNKQLDLGA